MTDHCLAGTGPIAGCDAVWLGCDLPPGHADGHETELDQQVGGHWIRTRIRWQYVRWGASTAAPPPHTESETAP